MKQYHFLYTLLIMLMVPLGSTAQKVPVRLVFKDGTVSDCLGKRKGDYVKFWKTKGSKPQTVAISKLQYVQFRYPDKGLETYRYMKIKGKEHPMVLQELVKGRISLYRATRVGTYTSGGAIGAGGTPTTMTAYNIIDHYVKKEGEKEPEHLVNSQLLSKNFKKAASEYFKDCPPLVQKLQEKVFKKKDVKKVVEYYNEQCGKTMD